MNKKITKHSVETNTDHKTGKATQTKTKQTFIIEGEPPYIKMYLQDIQRFYNLPASNSPMIYELLRKLDYDGLISLNPTNKKMICEKLNWKMGSLDNYLTKVSKCGLFKKIGTGTYQPNPNIFGRGSWSKIQELREAWINIEYTNEGKKIKTSFAEEKTKDEEKKDVSTLEEVKKGEE